MYKVVVLKLLDFLLAVTAWLELEAQAFRYTRINIANHVYVTNKFWFDLEDILLPHVVPFLQAHLDMTLQNDNTTSKTARSVRDFLQDRNVSV